MRERSEGTLSPQERQRDLRQDWNIFCHKLIRLKNLDLDVVSIPELTDYNDPESLLIDKETLG